MKSLILLLVTVSLSAANSPTDGDLLCDIQGAQTCQNNVPICVAYGEVNARLASLPFNNCSCYAQWADCLVLSRCTNSLFMDTFRASCSSSQCTNSICFSPFSNCDQNLVTSCDQAFVGCIYSFADQNLNGGISFKRQNGDKNLATSAPPNSFEEAQCGCYASWGSCLSAAGCQNTMQFQVFQANCVASPCTSVCSFLPEPSSTPSLSFSILALLLACINL